MFGIKTSTVDAIADTPGVQQILRKLRSRQHVFERCYSQRLWGSAESGSGCGSEIAATDDLRSYLPDLVGRLGVKLVLDAPCGDWNWMRLVDFGEVEYIGADIVPSVIDDNQSRYARPGVRFILAGALFGCGWRCGELPIRTVLGQQQQSGAARESGDLGLRWIGCMDCTDTFGCGRVPVACDCE